MHINSISNLIITQANATVAESSPILNMLPILVMFLVLYFLMIRPQVKRQKEHKNLISNLSNNDEIITSGGILGKIRKINENYIVIDISYSADKNPVDIAIQKNSIIGIMPKGTIKSL
ncbi:preprotein translocase subunit YajC [Candidatus Kinetoplastibacterium oncopeltii TCC290E]|uniref:Sec translocon accessory complex subunit YajC n=1 Tax=Candidatus Kinetoplastidibacterium stringomonadis TCC290E TaxID=1208920 RepID=M1LYA8_9PROT|nr:preprotein translocase subunit YajC [Candidatus Kinetoplastibacterium oncopeltii]AGF48144.1 preprotein translocase subunit YajC [Candidatus Kinetoplastibacterium oncopeltii TCC290E]